MYKSGKELQPENENILRNQKYKSQVGVKKQDI